MSDREAFENWLKNKKIFSGNDDNGDVIWAKNFMFKAWQARVPEGYVVVPMEPTEQILNGMTNAPIEVNHLCDNADIFLSEDEARIAYKAMIEAQEQSHE